MKKIQLSLLALLILACQSSVFTKTELEIIKKNQLDEDVLVSLKKQVQSDFVQFETSDPGYIIAEDGSAKKTGIESQAGISFNVAEDASDEIIYNYKDRIKAAGCLIFLSESGYDSPSKISVIKSRDQFDILTLQHTDGINHGLENSDIIFKLRDWHKRYGIEIIGADFDWVDLLITIPENELSAFAEEIYAFCPDAVDQGVGDLESLENLLREFNRVFLWWD